MVSFVPDAAPSPASDAVAGGVAAGVALGVAELVTAADDAGTSMVSAVGDEFVDRFAGSLKDIAIDLFGTNDKAALVVGIVVVSIAIGAGLGIGSRRRPWVGTVGFVAFAVLGAVAYSRAPLSNGTVGAIAAVLAGAAGVGTLRMLLALAASAARGGAAPPSLPAMGGATRRTFLTAAGAFTLVAGASAGASRRLRVGDPSAEARATTTLPSPTAATPIPSTQPFAEPGLSPYVTPTGDFYRIDTALTIPRVDPASWRLKVDGLVDRPFDLGFDELLALDAVEVPVTLQCVSNEVGGDLIDNAVWQGVPLAAILERAGTQPEGTQVIGRSVDGWTAGFPTEVLDDGRSALVAYAMNGELLPLRHGFPARLVVAGLYGYVSATKWLDTIELTRLEDVDGYWIPRGWAKDGPIKTMSRIDVPRSGTTLAPGPTAVAGIASAPARGISAVELRVDDGPWEPCTLGNVASDETWVQWHIVWDATPGGHELTVRAIDGDGDVQTADRTAPAPDGATGHHMRRVDVSGDGDR